MNYLALLLACKASGVPIPSQVQCQIKILYLQLKCMISKCLGEVCGRSPGETYFPL